MMLQAGQEFSHFKIIRKLGEGGMGEVYLAEDLKLNRQVALKILQSEYFDSSERLERFSREAKTAAGISHSNVMSIYDIGRATEESSGKDISYIVMEYIKGSSLSDHLRDRASNLKYLLRIAEKIASGLAAAHKIGIVHRDIKTDNIKIDEHGDPKILDFGLAKPVVSAVSSDDQASTQTVSKELTQEGKIIGTVTYMSPEQARGGTVDGRSDIFSFGIMLYKMFSGEFPFDGRDRVSTLAKILEARQEPLRRKNEAVPAELERIVDKCLQKDPADRYQDTRDLVVDLRSLRRQFESSISDTGSVITDAPAHGYKTRAPKYRLFFGVVAVAALILAAYMALNDSEDKPSSRLQASENALAILGFENKTGDESLDWLTAGLPEILLTDLAQSGSINLISRTRVMDCLDDEAKSVSGMPNHQACVDAARSIGASRVLLSAKTRSYWSTALRKKSRCL
jgi:serine/threonine protein kinase